ncbi:excinuclease ABC subunit UvrA [Spiroplasma platyhelix]|uniref:UvrABC system protein A n=1 Tax=Spiroplasma platyhelix PALS-1 TaxID=1276218 RepID=A0A846UDS4_9MOLU|nr:excinuclease ABC subunit UvrA [Spiroplasma platyhelix]MBE4704275.1 UvrABC system protein A [Spiroplasma platyhelix PALS-1]NKE38648.1 excinuclease ABC subunit UvrA [Spiroplasma platyhelix PALS-1]UJB28859.1 excinuclease ABC subunit A [Spiroplasma platyhelix PALS-1]
MNEEQKYIIVKGAREHNLKNINISIPKNQLVVITGVSGSGKSSLAFNTIYAEGRRRYVESLSAYARQFLGNSEKPDVDSIDGLSPAISIDQKTTSNNPRSTVGTVTEIYDYLRLLYARVGTPYCKNGHGEISNQTLKEMIKQIQTLKDETRIEILAPIVTSKKGTYQDLLAQLKKENFLRVKVDNKIYTLDEEIELNKNMRHDIDIVIDRIVFKNDDVTISRVHDALEVALEHSNELAKVTINDTNETWLFSQKYACKVCGFSLPNLEPRLFSFNAPAGACPECKGVGVRLEVDEDLLMPDMSLSINQGGIEYYKNIVNTTNLEWQKLQVLCHHYLIDLNLPLNKLTKEQIQFIMRGSKEPINYSLTSANGRKYPNYDYIEGVATLIERRYIETTSDLAREYYRKFMTQRICVTCKGSRLNEDVLSVKIHTTLKDKKQLLNISELTKLDIEESLEAIKHIQLLPHQQEIAKLVLVEINKRLNFLINVGLNYLSLSRNAQTLSGGESQRIRLATQIGAQLTGVLYVLDEPSIGLHQRDNNKLIATLKTMRDLGTTLLVVEHDEDTMLAADWLIDIGPKAGIHGGKVVAEGTPEEVMANPKSITGQYLIGTKYIELPHTRRSGNGQVLEIKNATVNNLNNLSAKFPLGKFICITGVSGSGKSSLINEVLYNDLHKILMKKNQKPNSIIKGYENVDKIIAISQEPIGRTPRSNPATYTSVFDDIRDLFASSPEAKIRGYTKSRFSFNVPGGRCERCNGDGVIKISMHFLPDVYVACEVCEGKRYNSETLQVKWKGKNIFDVLEMPVETALEFFANQAKIYKKLSVLEEVGLGYIKLGQQATELSGGEAQRIKLAAYLQKRATGKTMYILDEPTTGLHIDDIKKLIKVLNKIVDNGDTVIVIEHNLEVIKVADYIIDLGPEGGKYGGKIIATGTPEQVIKNENSYTGEFLKPIIARDLKRLK